MKYLHKFLHLTKSAAPGQGKGGAIFINTDATVTSTGKLTFSNNKASDATATETDNDNVYGTIKLLAEPSEESDQ